MSFPARVFRILIASPSDVTEEREIAVRAIQEWNDLNAAERQLVLLPLRWETHSAPEYGKRPQEVINRQVVDYCDLLVGIFWARVGSPTGMADSGTIEEIERVASKGKPVMLYFSQAKQDPDTIDVEQLLKLREFKKKTFPRALVETFSTTIEFKDKISKQIEIELRSIVAGEESAERGFNIRPVTDIDFQFAHPDTGVPIGYSQTLKTAHVKLNNFDKVPDYSRPAKPQTEQKQATDVFSLYLPGTTVNKDYYRQKLTYLVLRNFFRPLRFWLKNMGGIGARDVYIDLSVETVGSPSASFVFVKKGAVPRGQPQEMDSGGLFGTTLYPVKAEELLKEESGWNTHLELPALQPQREISPKVAFLIGAKATCNVLIRARIYADSLPEPTVKELSLAIETAESAFDATDILKDVGILESKT